MPQIEVGFHIDANGMVEVTARDLGTGHEQQVRVNAAGGLSDVEIDRMIREASDFADQDRAAKEYVELRNRAAGLLYTTDRSLDEYADQMTDQQIADIEDALAVCRDILDAQGHMDELHEAIARLEDAAYQLADAMYSQGAADGEQSE